MTNLQVAISKRDHLPCRRGGHFNRRTRERWAKIMFPAPAVTVLILLLIFPIVYTIVLSFHDWNIATGRPAVFIGLQNYADLLFKDTRFHWAAARTFGFTIAAVSIETVLGFVMALVFNKEFLGRGIFRTLFLLPLVATPVAMSLVWILILDPNIGLLNYLLSIAHLPQLLWIADPGWAMVSLIMVDVWQWTPLMMLIIMAGLSALPKEPFESAVIDGASDWQLLTRITLPLVRPTVVVALLFRSIDALKTFDTIYVITQGGPNLATETLNIFAYNEAFSYLHMGYASAVIVAFFTIVLSVSLLLIKIRRGSW
jgi:multiple sugar transport system permease protein